MVTVFFLAGCRSGWWL